MYKVSCLLLALFLLSCKSKKETIKPSIENISSSIYASGIIKSKNQYQVFGTVNGIITEVFITEGDMVKKGTPLFAIENETQKLNKENAELAAQFSDSYANESKLNDAKLAIDFAKNKMKNDSLLYVRQQSLWQQQIGTKVDLEQKELQHQNSKTNYTSAIFKYQDLKRQIEFNSNQSKKNLLISKNLQNDFTIKSEIEGKVYAINKKKGEITNAQSALAIIGDDTKFTLEMQVDEYDILKVKKGLPVLVNLESYPGKVFDATVTKINPLMNERSKSFMVEAEFVKKPEQLYANISFEASIILETKEKVLLIPKNYLVNDSTVLKANGEMQIIKTGLKDYNKVEIVSGLAATDELLKPIK
jgi:multidrug efflux pump subunit AcrA (membrane-fusion protein)